MLWFQGLLDAAWPWRHKSVRIWMLQLRWNQIDCQQARPGEIPFTNWGVSGSCRARVELKVWGVKERPQWEDEEQRAAEECEGGVEWDEKDCWLKRARPNGWVDRAYTDWVKNRVALFCPPPPPFDCRSKAVRRDHQSVHQQPYRLTACLHLPSSHSPAPAPAHSILNNVDHTRL